MDNCIVISDCHAPYHHKDTLAFLETIKYAYDIKIAKNVGDVADNHSSSYHEIEYGVLSAKDEYLRAKRFIQQLSDIFPEMTVALGNHCRMSYRKAKTAAIPEDALKSYNDLYGVNWNWVDHDYFKVDQYGNCLMTHAMSKNTLGNARSHSHHTIQGHYHGTFGIEYFADTEFLRWSMTVGCLIDHDSPAFNYSRYSTANKPIIGCGAIIENEPRLIKMQLKKSGRWNGLI